MYIRASIPAIFFVIVSLLAGGASAQDDPNDNYPEPHLVPITDSFESGINVSLNVTRVSVPDVVNILCDQAGIEAALLWSEVLDEEVHAGSHGFSPSGRYGHVNMHVTEVPFETGMSLLLQAHDLHALIETRADHSMKRMFVGRFDELCCPIRAAGKAVVMKEMLDLDLTAIMAEDSAVGYMMCPGHNVNVQNPVTDKDWRARLRYDIGGFKAIEMILDEDQTENIMSMPSVQRFPEEEGEAVVNIAWEDVRPILFENRDIVENIAIELYLNERVSGDDLDRIMNRIYF